jgi:hypothetical protein
VREDQRLIAEALRIEFPPDTVVTEWPALADEVGAYSPRVDIAVGPFATQTQYIAEYDHLESQHHELLDRLHRSFTDNLREFGSQRAAPQLDLMCGSNSNARCFLAIEVEGSGSRKHIMGGVVNASSLGRFGVSLASTDAHLRTLLRVREYMMFLGEVGKNRFNPKNSLLLTTHQFCESLGHNTARRLTSAST